MIDLAMICQTWNLPPILSTSIPTTGTIHQVRLLKTCAGDYALRIYHYHAEKRWRIDYEHALIAYAQAHGLPTLMPLQGTNGQTIFEHEGQFYALFPYARGYQSTRKHMSAGEVSAMGYFLGQLHQALHDYPHERVLHRPLTVDRVATLTLIDTIKNSIHAQTTLDDIDRHALDRLNERRSWLTIIQPLDPKAFALLERQVIHGDYQETNLFFENDKVSAVIDWDQAYVAPRAWEVVRTLHYALQLNETACHTFLSAYRQLLPLPAADLQVAADFYGWIRAFDVWHYEELYLKGNQRIRSFLKPGSSISFIERWTQVQASLTKEHI